MTENSPSETNADDEAAIDAQLRPPQTLREPHPSRVEAAGA